MASLYVTDPLINELKGYTAKLLKCYYNHETVSDAHPTILELEGCLENIFYCGIKGKAGLFGYLWDGSPWRWMAKTEQTQDFYNDRYPFTQVIECVRERKNVCTQDGRFRYAVRACLVKKCLHVPVEYLISTKTTGKYYMMDAIFADEILLQILLSVIYQLNKVDFKLDLENTCMMDLSWELPHVSRIQLVPTRDLGITVDFAQNKAIINEIKPNSVAFDCEDINVGDIIDTLNNVLVTDAMRTSFNALLKKKRCEPVVMTIIQAIPDRAGSGRLHSAMERLYKELRLDVALVRDSHLRRNPAPENRVIRGLKAINGFQVVQLGSIRLEHGTDAAAIDKAFSTFMWTTSACGAAAIAAAAGDGGGGGGAGGGGVSAVSRTKRDVLFEVGELCVKFSHVHTKRLIEQHMFMEISACSNVTLMPNYFAYIAGKGNPKTNQAFHCYFFIAPNSEIASIILKLIRNGFGRTYYAV